MTVQDLIDRLSEMNPDAEVRIASQPSWPFEYSIGRIAEGAPDRIISAAQFEAMGEEDQERAMHYHDEGTALILEPGAEPPEAAVYIAEGSQLGYLPSVAAVAVGWR